MGSQDSLNGTNIITESTNMKIAIIGHGFVGQAVEYGFTPCEKVIIDPKYNTSINEETMLDVDVAFICVPTPMNDDGSIDSRHIVSSLKAIENALNITSRIPIVVIKSTVTPASLDEICSASSLDIIYNPEFLTERSAKDDFVNPKFQILGGNKRLIMSILEGLYNDYSICTPAPFYHMSISEAAFVKYGINTFLATKVIFMNQLKEAASEHNFTKIANAMAADPRVGVSHTRVPGFDGKMGFGGSCFPKDVAAFASAYPELTLVNKVREINNDIRSSYELDDREKEQNVKFR